MCSARELSKFAKQNDCYADCFIFTGARKSPFRKRSLLEKTETEWESIASLTTGHLDGCHGGWELLVSRRIVVAWCKSDNILQMWKRRTETFKRQPKSKICILGKFHKLISFIKVTILEICKQAWDSTLWPGLSSCGGLPLQLGRWCRPVAPQPECTLRQRAQIQLTLGCLASVYFLNKVEEKCESLERNYLCRVVLCLTPNFTCWKRVNPVLHD